MSYTVQRDVAPGVHQVAHSFVNLFLVEGDDGDGVTVVDAGLPTTWEPLLGALATIGRSPADVRALLLTHAHFDHVGITARARQELGIPVLVHREDVSLLHHPWPFFYKQERLGALYLVRPRTALTFAKMTASGAMWVKPVRDPELLPADGTTLDVPGSPVVVETPGHTHGHVAFHLPERDCVIAGDALVTFDPYTQRVGPRPVAKAATADSALAWRSIDKLATLDRARVVVSGHGAPWTHGVAEAACLAHHAGQG